MSSVTQSEMAARYKVAEGLLPTPAKKLVDSPEVRPNWIGETDTFWYRNAVGETSSYVLVDAAAGTKAPAFDHAKVAEALNGVLEIPVEADKLPFAAIELDGDILRVNALGKNVEIKLDSYTANIVSTPVPGEVPSPDGRWAVGFKDHNLYLRDIGTDEVRELTTDGELHNGYGEMNESCAAIVMFESMGIPASPLVLWSPDSTKFVTHKMDQRNAGFMHLVRANPADNGLPHLYSHKYSVTGDPVEKIPTADIYVFDAASGSSVKAQQDPILTPFVPTLGYGFLWWSKDNSTVFYIETTRGDREAYLKKLDPATGAVTLLLEQPSTSQVLQGPQHFERNQRVLTSGEILWWSQRTDYSHLYLYATDGAITTLTSGDWNVRNVVGLDEDSRTVFFTASGRSPGKDIYQQELCSVSLDGGEITALTDDALDHDVVGSPSGRYFVDIQSWVDVPAISVLRDATGAVLLDLETADASRLYAAGWTAPERVVVKSADGKYDLYCTINKPVDFDETKSYPVIDEIYPGPQNTSAHMRFPYSGGPMVASIENSVYPALGIIHVTVDARGTALRTRSFQDYARKDGGKTFADDHAEAIKQLGATRPWMDLDRVGIFGHSAGGYGSTRAILERPDFFKVAMSSCGNHDNRINHSWWGEKWFGLADEFDFAAQANASIAHQLEGKLQLTHGSMDDNAVAHATSRLVDALVAANKEFELITFSNDYHQGAMRNPYWIRKRWDFAVTHLLGETPPADYTISASSVPPVAHAGPPQ